MLGLVSHVHRDHFQPMVAARFLAANKKAAMALSPQAMASLENVPMKGIAGLLRRVRPIPLEPGGSHEFDLSPKDASIRILDIQHGQDEQRSVSNYAHLIRIGDLKLLHIGDADVKRSLFEPLDLASEEIDVAFIPSWFYASEEGAEIIDTLIRPKIPIACHIPVADRPAFIEMMKVGNPQVLIFEKSMDSRTFSSSSGT